MCLNIKFKYGTCNTCHLLITFDPDLACQTVDILIVFLKDLIFGKNQQKTQKACKITLNAAS